jgi:hypothetical protein
LGSIVSTIILIVIIIIVVIVEHYTSHDILAEQIQNESPHRKSEGVGFKDTHNLTEQRNRVELFRGRTFDAGGVSASVPGGGIKGLPVQITCCSFSQYCVSEVDSQSQDAAVPVLVNWRNSRYALEASP